LGNGGRGAGCSCAAAGAGAAVCAGCGALDVCGCALATCCCALFADCCAVFAGCCALFAGCCAVVVTGTAMSARRTIDARVTRNSPFRNHSTRQTAGGDVAVVLNGPLGPLVMRIASDVPYRETHGCAGKSRVRGANEHRQICLVRDRAEHSCRYARRDRESRQTPRKAARDRRVGQDRRFTDGVAVPRFRRRARVLSIT